MYPNTLRGLFQCAVNLRFWKGAIPATCPRSKDLQLSARILTPQVFVVDTSGQLLEGLMEKDFQWVNAEENIKRGVHRILGRRHGKSAWNRRFSRRFLNDSATKLVQNREFAGLPLGAPMIKRLPYGVLHPYSRNTNQKPSNGSLEWKEGA